VSETGGERGPRRRARLPGWDRNPLRRRIDRVETGMVAGLIVLFLTAAPVLTAAAVHWTRTQGLREQRTEAVWQQVAATVQPAPAHTGEFSGWPGTVLKRARWTAPDGQPRSGWAPVSAAAPPGSSVRIWVNRSGSLTGPPLHDRQLHAQMVMAAVLTATVLGLMVFLTGGAARFLLARRRLAAWDRQWRTVGPQWTRQLL
jgi:hypothetical protein